MDNQRQALTGYRFFNEERFCTNVQVLTAFAEQQGFSAEVVDKFIDYNLMNSLFSSMMEHLCDKHGNIIRNVYGAFIRFATSGYDRAEWERTHGIVGGRFS